MILNDLNAIFIHVPKTGGNTLTREIFTRYSSDRIVVRGHQDGLNRFELENSIAFSSKKSRCKRGGYRKHMSVKEYQRIIDCTDQTIIVVFRDPVDRLLSLYYSPHNWMSPKLLARTFYLVSNTLHLGLEYSVGSYNRIKPQFDKGRFKQLVSTARSFSQFLDGWEQCKNILLLDFNRLIDDSMRLEQLGIDLKQIEMGMKHQRNRGSVRYDDNVRAVAKEIVFSSQHVLDLSLADKIKVSKKCIM
jgi:hypothetical protein